MWVYLAWLAWGGTVVWVIRQTLQGALDGLVSYYWTIGLAGLAGLLTIPLFQRPTVVNMLIVVPVWLFGGGYTVMSLVLPLGWFLVPFFGYAGALIGGGVAMGVWERVGRRGRA